MTWNVPFTNRAALNDLETELRAAETRTRREDDRRFESILFLVDRYAGFKVDVYANEHPPPHFHVSCAAGEASSRISNGAMLNGDLRSEASTIRKWCGRNKSKLIDAWNRSRLTSCAVGESGFEFFVEWLTSDVHSRPEDRVKRRNPSLQSH